MKPNYNIDTENSGSSSNIDQNIATLRIIGGVISTVGGIISTCASILALEQLQKSQENTVSNEDQINELKKQVQYLTEEINKQKLLKK